LKRIHSISINAGQAIVAGFPGQEPSADLLRAAERGQLGGFILFSRNFDSAAEAAELDRALIAAFPPEAPPWISVDQEGGRVARLAWPVVRLPAMRVLGEVDDPDLTQQAAAVLGGQLRCLGFNLDFAPVLDVDSNPANPVIGDRAFGSDPDRITRHGLAFARGLQRAGVAACGKHFPGHGDTGVDSHLALPCLAHDMERLEAVELVPFRAAAATLAAVMTAHVVFEKLEPGVPATLSPKALGGLLRRQIGFQGVVFSDDLQMKAIEGNHGLPEAACLAMEAGCDAVLVCSRPELALQAHEALVRRAEARADFAEILRRAAARSLEARRRYPAAVAQERGRDIEALLLGQDPAGIERRIAARVEV
jgi:beta-N-acetylhexosaminidase